MTDTATHWMPDAVPAATVVVLRDGHAGLEALMLLRDRGLAFAGGTYVFPGGRIDPADHEPGGTATERDMDHAAKNAAIREAEEEAGLTLDPASLRRWSHWTPPPGQKHRFTTAFFVARAPEGEVVIDDGEIRDFAWWTPEEVLRRRAEGLLTLTPPTFVTLEQLRAFRTTEEVLTAERPDPVEHFLTHFVATEDALISLWHGDAAYPDGDPAAPGPRHRLRMTETDWQYLREVHT